MDGTCRVQVVIDGENFAGEYRDAHVSTPRVLYLEDDGRCVKRFAGPQGFQITLTEPSPRLLALVDGGRVTHTVTVRVEGQAITHPTRFLAEWVTTEGIRKVFGVLAWDFARDAKWVEDLQPDSTELISDRRA